ncbi:MAG: MMPL family transporter [Lachnospiraceae bacterium]|nr:MMPL family transporter [Lachnospiraceae bacterium]
MQKFFTGLVRHKKIVLVLYMALIILCAYLSTKVKVNSDLADYLPPDSDSTIALSEMEAEFSGDIPNASMMVTDISMAEADKLQKSIQEVDGVLDVSGIADENPLGMPYEFLGEGAVETYYKDGHALYSLTLDTEKKIDLLDDLRALTDKKVSFSGSFVTGKTSQKTSGPEIFKTVGIVIIFAIFLFLATMDSWITPFLLVGTLLAAVVINAGTNLMFGTISSVTNTAASVLQMGVSVDYFIFILHRFREYKDRGEDSENAMILALTHSGGSVVSSSLTTIIGFVALVFMRYRIGMDMGIVLSKGVIISLICAFTLLPCLVLSLEKMMTRTQHKPLIQTAYTLSEICMKVRYPAMVIFILFLIPALLLQSQNNYYYGSSHFYDDSHPVMQDKAEIDSVFGLKNTLVLLLPKGHTAKESQLTEALKAIPEMLSVTSFTGTLGVGIPYEVLPKDITSLLISEDYSRMVLVLDADEESEETFDLLDHIKETAQSFYEEKVHLVGGSVSTEDLKYVISQDSNKVNLIAVVAIFFVLLISMRRVKLPILLTLSIEGAIWISMSISTLKGDWLFYIGYLIVSSILLGSTVDYAILVTNRFLEFRKNMDVNSAIKESIAHSAVSVLTSALILITAGVLLGIICTDQLMAQLGNLLARGTLTAVIVVLFALPGLLRVTSGKECFL